MRGGSDVRGLPILADALGVMLRRASRGATVGGFVVRAVVGGVVVAVAALGVVLDTARLACASA